MTTNCRQPWLQPERNHYRYLSSHFGINNTIITIVRERIHGILTQTICYIVRDSITISTYDHRVWKIGLPVRSAVLKPHAGRLVVGWVTTSESLLLYVFVSNFTFTAV
ncbi:hypothetical protein BO95DRAFT_358441 [Aspergillus brunneoviolaceus CBS 621.78]|uniref:Uncharacterized protein n=1 Tax=Aspergillus brunneoviolaceus CBS 621.78 TaxID=1450534 RepID=A0ACD1GEG6_9EURO|nr:hypothetical protein BO95DRAFT_358441 [Aspergillus brunneoviolaceus CBS 621.78]RAH47679.1 hypothetical protein BO95DRAFT_358441 [Aspergillus brunneoviolaceus CBS 621.78]